jgi:hypothetical protein
LNAIKTLLGIAITAPPFLLVLMGCDFHGLEPFPQPELYTPGMEAIFCQIDAGRLDECASDEEIAMGVDMADIYGNGFWSGRSSKFGLRYSAESDAACGVGRPFKITLQGAFPEGSAACVDAGALYGMKPGVTVTPVPDFKFALKNTCQAWCDEQGWVDGDGNPYRCDSVSWPMDVSPSPAPIPNACSEAGVFRDDLQDLRRLKPKPVVWNGVLGVTVMGSSLTKAGFFQGWNAGADTSQFHVLQNADGFVEFTPGDDSTRRRIGLALGDSDGDISELDIDYALELRETGELVVFENHGGSPQQRSIPITYAKTDRLRIAVQRGVVQYFVNGFPFFTSELPVAAGAKLRVSVSMFTLNATLTDVNISF